MAEVFVSCRSPHAGDILPDRAIHSRFRPIVMPHYPDFATFSRLASGVHLVPVYRRLIADSLTPVSANCPACGNRLYSDYSNFRTLTSLTAVTRYTLRISRCRRVSTRRQTQPTRRSNTSSMMSLLRRSRCQQLAVAR